jgi:hypothetical protein
MSNHDDHYSKMKIQPVDVQEQILAQESGLTPTQKHHICEAIAYQMRAGLKEGQDWRKDLEKAENYLHRARTGKWRVSEKTSDTTQAIGEDPVSKEETERNRIEGERGAIKVKFLMLKDGPLA